jgi:hypothetical protein
VLLNKLVIVLVIVLPHVDWAMKNELGYVKGSVLVVDALIHRVSGTVDI